MTDFLNLRTEKYAKELPKASNGRPDSVYQYFYYKAHYLDGINFKDERIVRVPFFADRIKKYINDIIVQQPDTIIKELDRILRPAARAAWCTTAFWGILPISSSKTKSCHSTRKEKQPPSKRYLFTLPITMW